MLKCDFHLHTYHPSDNVYYTPKELIDYMAAKGYDVISITNHGWVEYTEKLADYAKKKGLLLIPGVELSLEGKDILLINHEDIRNIKKIKDLYKIKSKDNLIIAPHPYFLLSHCLGKKLEKHIKLFDCVEYSHFYNLFLNLNKKAELIADKYELALVGNSDAHNFCQIGHTYTFVDADKNIDSIINAVKNRKIKLVTKPLPVFLFLRIALWEIKTLIYKTFIKIFYK